jgi:hypothetical protein
MSKKARTPIVEYNDHFAIELPGDGSPQERDRLTDQAMVVAYDRQPGGKPRWRLLAGDQLSQPIPEVCRSYDAPDPHLPTIILCHRNTPMLPAQQQMDALKRNPKSKGPHA